MEERAHLFISFANCQMQENRYEDIPKTTQDPDFREHFYKKYGLKETEKQHKISDEGKGNYG
ncbi:MAG: hypothetical protein E7294_02185 [Lachnospiraceae bacterium]|nr:hypothetical protein [Lachnospiraceae bacterium]